jgi:hypothetical protein
MNCEEKHNAMKSSPLLENSFLRNCNDLGCTVVNKNDPNDNLYRCIHYSIVNMKIIWKFEEKKFNIVFISSILFFYGMWRIKSHK